jgi:hypothetical protein
MGCTAGNEPFIIDSIERFVYTTGSLKSTAREPIQDERYSIIATVVFPDSSGLIDVE